MIDKKYLMLKQNSVVLTLTFIATQTLMANAACTLADIAIDYTKTFNLTTPTYTETEWPIYVVNNGCGAINVLLATSSDGVNIINQQWATGFARYDYSGVYTINNSDETVPVNVEIPLVFLVKYKATAGSTYRTISNVPVWVKFTACIISEITTSSTASLPMTIGVGDTESLTYTFDQAGCYYSMANFAVTDSNGVDLTAWVTTFDNGD